MINLRSRKDVHIPNGVLKRIIEFISTQEEKQVKEELQHHTFQPTGLNSQVTISTEDDDSAFIGDVVASPTISNQNMAKEEQLIQLATA